MLYSIGLFRRNDIDIFFCSSIFFPFLLSLRRLAAAIAFVHVFEFVSIVRTPFRWASNRINIDRLQIARVYECNLHRIRNCPQLSLQSTELFVTFHFERFFSIIISLFSLS